MIEVTCPTSRTDTHRYLYNMRKGIPLINLNINENGVKFETELTVAEAEQLASNLLEWTREIKDEEENA